MTTKHLPYQPSMLQMSFDAHLAALAKGAALQQVEAHAAPEWKAYALATVKRVAEHCAEFSTDAVIKAMRDAPVMTHEGRALGAVMVRAARSGWIKNTGRFEKSDSVSRHRAPKTIWKSLLFKG